MDKKLVWKGIIDMPRKKKKKGKRQKKKPFKKKQHNVATLSINARKTTPQHEGTRLD